MVTAGRSSRLAVWSLFLLLVSGLLTVACDNAEQLQPQHQPQPSHTIDEDGERVAQVDAAGDETCVITTASEVYCWGGQGWGPRFIRDIRHALDHARGSERRIVDISIGRNSGCAIDEQGGLGCWYPKGGKIRAGAVEFSTPVTEVAAGAEMWCFTFQKSRKSSCSLTGYLFDDLAYGGYEPVRRSQARYQALSAGDYHVCGLTEEGIVDCWGHNGAGQMDAPDGEYQSLSSGQWHSCAIDLQGAIDCWGDNTYGQAATPDGTFSAVAPGGRHTCAVTTDEELRCWGDNSRKQSEPPPGVWIAVSSGDNHSCAISVDRALACWGSNEHGQTDIPGGKWVQVDIGALEHRGAEFCALREDGLVACANNLQIYASRGLYVPQVPKAPAGRWSAIDLGSSQRCLQDERQQIQCWRWNERHGVTTEYLAPIPQRAAGYQKFSAGGIYVCLIDERQILRCVRSSGSWSNDFANKLNPQPVTIWPGRFADVAVGYRHVCAIDLVGDVECVQLDRIIDQSLLPDLPPLPDLNEPVATLKLDADQNRGCGSDQEPECPDPPGCLLTKSGAAFCWGRGTGDRWIINAQQPYAAIGVGCGLSAGGAIECWDGTELLLTQDAGAFNSLGSSGVSHCATTIHGDIHCWGSIGIVIEDRELMHGAFHVPGVKIAALRPVPSLSVPISRTR